jgi:hypothetical protein
VRLFIVRVPVVSALLRPPATLWHPCGVRLGYRAGPVVFAALRPTGYSLAPLRGAIQLASHSRWSALRSDHRLLSGTPAGCDWVIARVPVVCAALRPTGHSLAPLRGAIELSRRSIYPNLEPDPRSGPKAVISLFNMGSVSGLGAAITSPYFVRGNKERHFD